MISETIIWPAAVFNILESPLIQFIPLPARLQHEIVSIECRENEIISSNVYTSFS